MSGPTIVVTGLSWLVAEKAERIVAGGRVRIIEERGDFCAAVVRGDHGLYAVTLGPLAESCTCKTIYKDDTPTCSHREAVRIFREEGTHGK
jgi:uncharacterized Zn finger protein